MPTPIASQYDPLENRQDSSSLALRGVSTAAFQLTSVNDGASPLVREIPSLLALAPGLWRALDEDAGVHAVQAFRRALIRGVF